jgi:hypothetical protein
MKSVLMFIAFVICLFVGMFAYAIRDNNQIREKESFDKKIHSLGYGDSIVLNELDNPFIIEDVENNLNDSFDSIYLGNTLCKKIRKDGQTYFLSRDNRSLFKANVSYAKLNPVITGKLLKISVMRK